MKMLYEVYWTAAMVDGEGSIVLRSAKQTPCLVVANTDMEILTHLQRLWGGAIYQNKPVHASRKPCYNWTVISNQAIGLMMTLYPLLTTRRQERIRKVIAAWRATNTRVELRETEALAVMRRVFAGELLYKVAESVCIHKYTLQQWMAGRKRPELLDQLKQEGRIPLERFAYFADRRKRLSDKATCNDAQVLDAIRRVRNGESSYAVSLTVGACSHSVTDWVRGIFRPYLLAQVLQEEQQRKSDGVLAEEETLPLPFALTSQPCL